MLDDSPCRWELWCCGAAPSTWACWRGRWCRNPVGGETEWNNSLSNGSTLKETSWWKKLHTRKSPNRFAFEFTHDWRLIVLNAEKIFDIRCLQDLTSVANTLSRCSPAKQFTKAWSSQVKRCNARFTNYVLADITLSLSHFQSQTHALTFGATLAGLFKPCTLSESQT